MLRVSARADDDRAKARSSVGTDCTGEPSRDAAMGRIDDDTERRERECRLLRQPGDGMAFRVHRHSSEAARKGAFFRDLEERTIAAEEASFRQTTGPRPREKAATPSEVGRQVLALFGDDRLGDDDGPSIKPDTEATGETKAQQGCAPPFDELRCSPARGVGPDAATMHRDRIADRGAWQAGAFGGEGGDDSEPHP